MPGICASGEVLLQPVKNAVFQIPLFDTVLIYAPLHHCAALVNQQAARELKAALVQGTPPTLEALSSLVELFGEAPQYVPAPRRGPFVPGMLGILPTRDCNFACQYCGYLDGTQHGKLPVETARQAVSAYVALLQQHRQGEGRVHFFGGEPLVAPDVVEAVVDTAREMAAQAGIRVAFEVTTNGAFSVDRAHWVRQHIDTTVLSFDGPPDIQNLHRPFAGGQPSFEAVYRTAQILSEGPGELALRACVTADTVARMPEIAAWFCAEFDPAVVSFEPVQPSPWSQTAQLAPPDPVDFARYYLQAAKVLAAHGVSVVYASAETSTVQGSFCPVGNDGMIVGPDGSLAACYLQPREWQAQGLDLTFGRVDSGEVVIDPAALAPIRDLHVNNKAFCATCFDRWHCAGGCHVNHRVEGWQPGAFDRLCVQARLIALANILHDLGQEPLVTRLLDDPEALARAIGQPSDLLVDWSA